MRCLTDLKNRHTGQKNARRKVKKLGRPRRQELNESRAFVEITENRANAVKNDNISLYLRTS